MSVRILVTGSDGLLGQSLKKVAPEYIYVSRRDADLRISTEVDLLFDKYKPHVVVHLASRVGGVYDNMHHNYEYLMENIQIHSHVIDMCKKYRVRKLINILSTCIFPDTGITYPMSSSDMHHGPPHASNSGYAYSKRFLHIASSILQESFPDIHVVNLVPTNLFGEHDQFNLEKAHVVPALLHKAYLASQQLEREACVLHVRGSGKARRQFLYSGDMARVIQHFVEQTYDHTVTCVVSPPARSEMTIDDLAHHILDAFEMRERCHIIYATTEKEDDGQVCKTTDDHELLRYIPDFVFCPFPDALTSVAHHVRQSYDTLRK